MWSAFQGLGNDWNAEPQGTGGYLPTLLYHAQIVSLLLSTLFFICFQKQVMSIDVL